MDLFKKLFEMAIGFLAKKEVTIEIPMGVPAEAIPAPEPVKEAPKPELPSYVLTHKRFCADGIFGELHKSDGTFIAYTLEHSYDNLPKLANGEYTCERGLHRLHGMTEDFITFEIKGVPDFQGKSVTGVLFHWGNYNSSSEGCVLLGDSETPTMITNSRKTWAEFMKDLDGLNQFKLVVISNI